MPEKLFEEGKTLPVMLLRLLSEEQEEQVEQTDETLTFKPIPVFFVD